MDLASRYPIDVSLTVALGKPRRPGFAGKAPARVFFDPVLHPRTQPLGHPLIITPEEMSSYYGDSSYVHRSHSHSHSHHHHHDHDHHSGYISSVPIGADPQLWQYFAAVDTNRSGALNVGELRNALVNGNWTKFDLDTVKMLMDIFDTDRTGTIGFNEFTRLWQYIADWQRAFRRFDRDQSGTIERRELSEALRSFGYNLSPALLTLLEHKYASTGSTSVYGAPLGISFDRFVRACVTVKTLTEAFQRFDPHNEGCARFTYEEFMRVTLMAP